MTAHSDTIGRLIKPTTVIIILTILTLGKSTVSKSTDIRALPPKNTRTKTDLRLSTLIHRVSVNIKIP